MGLGSIVEQVKFEDGTSGDAPYLREILSSVDPEWRRRTFY